MDSKISQQVAASFSTPPSVKKYKDDVTLGLWESEKILIQQYFKPNSKVLDAGCGIGRTTFPLIQMGYNVTAIDVTPKFIDLAKELSITKNVDPNIFQVADATSLPFEDASFDNALFSYNGWTMIPTKQGRDEAVREVFRVLKSGGHYIITAHKRQVVGQELIWFTQWIRLNLLKPLGYKTPETDFGDFYFRKDAETSYPIDQFVNIPSIKEVIEPHKAAGFTLEFMKMRSEISVKDKELKSGDVMFFVFKRS